MTVLHNGMRVVTKEPADGLWFKHESYYDLQVLNPISYKLLKERKGEFAVTLRKAFDNNNRKLLPQHQDYTYLFATVVDGNMMEDPLLYTGYTYYFRLSDTQIEQCLYTIMDETKWMEPTLGSVGLKRALELWAEFQHLFARPKQIAGVLISPRIEVIIPFGVHPDLVVLQSEDR